MEALLQAEAQGLGDGRDGSHDLGRANALAAATWVIRCVRKTDKQRAVQVDGTAINTQLWPPAHVRTYSCCWLLVAALCPGVPRWVGGGAAA